MHFSSWYRLHRTFDRLITSLFQSQSNQELWQKMHTCHIFNLSMICVGCWFHLASLWLDYMFVYHTYTQNHKQIKPNRNITDISVLTTREESSDGVDSVWHDLQFRRCCSRWENTSWSCVTQRERYLSFLGGIFSALKTPTKLKVAANTIYSIWIFFSCGQKTHICDVFFRENIFCVLFVLYYKVNPTTATRGGLNTQHISYLRVHLLPQLLIWMVS